MDAFGGHVQDRADEIALSGPACRRLAADPSYAEIHDLHIAIGQDHDICWLDIAMHDAIFMGKCQALGGLGQNAGLFQQRKRIVVSNDLLEAFPFHQFHHYVWGILIEIVDGDDILMFQFRGGLHFKKEAREGIGIVIRDQRLDRYILVGPWIISPIDNAEGTPANLGLNLVVADIGEASHVV